MATLSRGGLFYREEPLEIEAFSIPRHGKIPDSQVAALLDSFAVKPKNKKYFERASTLLFAVIEGFASRLEASEGERTGLFCATGPANASLSEFRQWAAAIDDAERYYPAMMASSVIKLLPNIVMSNLSINFGWRGENAIFTSGGAPGADALNAMLISLEERRSHLAVAAAVCSPFEYFNMDSYTRFLAPGFFSLPLCESASAVLCCSRGHYAENKTALSCFEPEGAFVSIDFYRLPDSPCLCDDLPALQNKCRSFIEKAGYDLGGVSLFSVSPSPCGNFLNAAEPLAAASLIHRLNASGAGGHAVSASVDYFGNVSVIKASGKLSLNL